MAVRGPPPARGQDQIRTQDRGLLSCETVEQVDA
jgi:hypothetical protein